jgi:hypothetical protein
VNCGARRRDTDSRVRDQSGFVPGYARLDLAGASRLQTEFARSPFEICGRRSLFEFEQEPALFVEKRFALASQRFNLVAVLHLCDLLARGEDKTCREHETRHQKPCLSARDSRVTLAPDAGVRVVLREPFHVDLPLAVGLRN